MSNRLETAANLLTSCACVVIAAVGVLEIRHRLRVQARPIVDSAASRPDAVEVIDGPRLALDTAVAKDLSRSDIVVIEFSDFECPFCGRYARDVFPKIRKELVASGQVGYMFRHFPLNMHPNALQAARASECARSYGKFWEMHELFFARQTALKLPDLTQAAASVGLQTPAFLKCVTSDEPSAVDRDIADARKLGVNSTPTFFIGRLERRDGQPAVHLLRRLRGLKPFTTFESAIKSMRSASPQTATGS